MIERVKELEHGGYQFEAADGSFELLLRQEAGEYEPLFRLESWRVIVEQRADGKVETEATIKIWVDGERYVRTAEGNGPVNALDAALRAAIVEVHPHLARHRARQLQGPHPRRDARHRRGHARAHRRLRRHTTSGARSACTRTSSPPRGRRWSTRWSSPSSRPRGGRARRDARRCDERQLDGDPARPARPRAPRRRRRSSRSCAPGQLSLGPRVPAFEEAFAARVGAAHASAVSSGTAGLHLALRAVGVERGRRGRHLAVLVRRQRQRARLRAREAGLRRHRPGHAEPRPGGRGGGDHRPHDGAAARPHLRLPGRPAGLRGARAADRRGRLRGARRRPRRRPARRRARPPGGLRLLRQQAADHRRGRHDHARRRRA